MGKREVQFVSVNKEYNQRKYFCFYDYEYELDVTRQNRYLDKTIDLLGGLQESYVWYIKHKDSVQKKDYMELIDLNLIHG